MISVVLLVGFLSMDSCQAKFYVSPRTLIWNGSDNECMPATPKVGAAISYSPNAYNVDNLGIDLPYNEEIWVGYYQVEKVFEYIGCVQYRYMPTRTHIRVVTINGDPGHCFPGCGDDIIVGVTKTKCYCLGDKFDFPAGMMTKKDCTHECNHPIVACGKTFGIWTLYLSIYKINDKAVFPRSISETPSTKLREMDCLNVMPSAPKTFYWDSCILSHYVMCYRGMHVRRLVKQKYNSQSNFCSWIDAANACFARGLFPTLYNNSKETNSRNSSQLWTGVFKTNVTYKCNGNTEHAKIQYGYLTKTKISGTDVHLQFTELDSTKRKLCLKDEDMTTGASASSTSTRSNRSDTDEEGSGIYVGVGVTVAIILLAVVIIVLTLFFKWRRRENPSHTCKRHDNTSGHHKYNYPEITMPSSIQVENKAIGDENVSYSTIKESNVYDTTETSHDYEKVKAENVYNYPDTGGNTTYDQALGGNGSKTAVSKGKILEDTYDTSKEVTRCIVTDGHTDNIYNKVGDTDNNEYSHLGEKKRQPATDNLYGYQRRISENGSVNGGGV